MAASPLIAMATSVALAPDRLTARRMASPTAFASTIAFSFTELGGVGSAEYDSTRIALTALRELNQLHRRGRNIEPQKWL